MKNKLITKQSHPAILWPHVIQIPTINSAKSYLKESLTLTPSQSAKTLKVPGDVSIDAVFIKRGMVTLVRFRHVFIYCFFFLGWYCLRGRGRFDACSGTVIFPRLSTKKSLKETRISTINKNGPNYPHNTSLCV